VGDRSFIWSAKWCRDKNIGPPATAWSPQLGVLECGLADTALDGLHGGFARALLDIVSTYAIATIPPAQFGVSVNLNVSYTKAAQEGDTLTITSKVMKSGKTLAFANIEIKNQKDELIAFDQHTKFVANE